MGLDVGTLRIGLALSDELGITVRPLGCLVRSRPGEDADRVAELARRHGVGRLVFGLPRHMDGRPGDTAPETRAFAALVSARCGLPVAWCDERLSSKEAEDLMAEAKVPVGRRRARRDEFAAAVILRRYLEEGGS